MDGQMDRQMDDIDFLRRCPTNVERPKRKVIHNYFPNTGLQK